MSAVQTSYDRPKPSSTRPRVDMSTVTGTAEVTISFDDSRKSREVAVELARLLGCSPEDFGYGEQAGKPVSFDLEEALVELALTIAHLKCRLWLPPKAEDVEPTTRPGG